MLVKLFCFFGKHDWRMDAIKKIPEKTILKKILMEFPKRECRNCKKVQRLFDQKTEHWMDWDKN